MSKEEVVKDIFGTPVHIGNVIILSKGTRGHRNFDYGIVTEMIPNKKTNQVWIKTVYAWRSYNYQTQTYGTTFSLMESRHLSSKEKNNNILVVTDVNGRPDVDEKISSAGTLLVSSGRFPANYKLGDSILPKEEPLSLFPVEVETKIAIINEVKTDELDLFAGMGMPTSLRK